MPVEPGTGRHPGVDFHGRGWAQSTARRRASVSCGFRVRRRCATWSRRAAPTFCRRMVLWKGRRRFRHHAPSIVALARTTVVPAKSSSLAGFNHLRADADGKREDTGCAARIRPVGRRSCPSRGRSRSATIEHRRRRPARFRPRSRGDHPGRRVYATFAIGCLPRDREGCGFHVAEQPLPPREPLGRGGIRLASPRGDAIPREQPGRVPSHPAVLVH